MIEFGKITGEVENNLIQVKMRTGENLYAAVTTMGTSVSAPSEKWIQDNKDNFLALVTFEKDLDESPMIIGFYPVRGADSSHYNTHELLIKIMEELLNQLKKARVNTQIGPQNFMPDTLVEIDRLISKVKVLESNINTLRL